MSLASDYRRQHGWRGWQRVFDALPPLAGRAVLDLGCGIGEQAAELTSRGARVIGFDMNEGLLEEARARDLANAEFHLSDLRGPLEIGVAVDGLWCSFAAAYFPDLPVALTAWGRSLRQGGWAALTEVDDLFGHEPLEGRARILLEAYARDALAAGRYDFHMGGKLAGYLERSGFTVANELELEDQEFAFNGRALPEVVEGWRNRFDRMNLLREYCGADFEQVRDEFLACLTRADHRSLCKVYCCVATR